MSDNVQLKLLYQVIEIANSSIDPKERQEQILDAINRALNIKESLLFLQNQENKAFVLSHSSPRKLREVLPVVWQPAHDMFSSFMLHRQPVLLDDSYPDDKVTAFLKHRGTVLMLPVFDDSSLYGMLVLMCCEAPSEDDRIVLQTIARAIAGMIRNYAHYLESRKRITELSLLAEVGKVGSSVIQIQPLLETIVNLVCRFLGASFGVIGVESDTGEKLSASFGVKPDYLESRDHDLKDCMSFNARQGRLIYGQLHQLLPFQSRYKGHLCLFEKMSMGDDVAGPYFTGDDRRILNITSTMLAPALENALNFRHVKALAESNAKMVNMLAALFEIGKHLLISTSFRRRTMVTLGALVHPEGFGFPRAIFLGADHHNERLVARAVMDADSVSQKLSASLAALTSQSVEKLMERYAIKPSFSFSLKSKSNILVKTLLSGSMKVVREPRKDGSKRLLKIAGEGPWVLVPLSSRGKGVGVLLLCLRHDQFRTEDQELTMLRMLADQVEMALEGSFTLQNLRKAHQELATMHTRLLEADRLAALGEIVSGMAHEIRNPLMTIGGFVKRVRKKMADDDINASYLDTALEQVMRVENLLGDMFAIPYDPGDNYRSIQMEELLEESLTLLGDMLEGIEVKRVYHKNLPPVYVDERLLKQAFFNIMLNAVQAMNNHGKLILRTRRQTVNNILMVAGEVEDSGGGMTLQTMHNVFNPFFTTRPQGSGLGLSYAYKIVTRHEGIIEVHNQGQGAAFVICLPALAPGKAKLK